MKALYTLHAAMSTYKNHLVSWCARTSLTPNYIKPKKFNSSNLHYLLPPVILFSISTGNTSTRGSDSTLTFLMYVA